jgi:hypothetical protein
MPQEGEEQGVHEGDSDYQDGDSHVMRLLSENQYEDPKQTGSNNISQYFPKRFRWLAGPSKPRRHAIRPFRKAEDILLGFRNSLAPTPLSAFVIFTAATLFWAAIFVSLAAVNNSSPEVSGYGSARRLICTSSPWLVTQALHCANANCKVGPITGKTVG